MSQLDRTRISNLEPEAKKLKLDDRMRCWIMKNQQNMTIYQIFKIASAKPFNFILNN